MTRPWPVLCLLAAIALPLAGCPELSIVSVDVAPESLTPGRATVTANLEVKYDQETCSPAPGESQAGPECSVGPDAHHGHGLIGIWLPAGWQATEARARNSETDDTIVLEPMAYTAPAFPDTFPRTNGAWWPFMSRCVAVYDGVVEYVIEFDITGPQEATAVTVGITATPIDRQNIEDETTHIRITNPPPFEASIDWPERRAVTVAPVQRDVPLDPEANAILGECDHDPLSAAPIERGPRGCSCGQVNPTANERNLIALAFAALFSL